MPSQFSRSIPAFAAFALAAAPLAVHAQAADPAAVRVGTFYGTLLDTMKASKALGFSGRMTRLQPAVAQSFALPAMAQFAVGPAWSGLSAADRASVLQAFSRYTVASYAHNFDSFDGQRFVIDPAVQTRGPDKLVRTQIVSPHDAPVNLNYRLRQYGGSWKVIDVYYNAISQLTTQRSDFASAIQSGGAQALVSRLNALTAKLH